MKIVKYKERYHKKTDIRFETLIECNEWLIKLLKTWKGTPATIDIIERKNNEIKQELHLIDPAIERIINPRISIKLNGFHNINEVV